MTKIADKRSGDPGFYPPHRKVDFYRPNRPRFEWIGTDPLTGEILPSMTKQSEMDACDIHNILKQYSPAGLAQLIAENAAKGSYVDLPDEVDYQTALNTVMEGQRAFATLPSHVRERFHNDPAEFLEFVANPANQDEAIQLGLATDTRVPEPPPTKVEVVNSPEKSPAKD